MKFTFIILILTITSTAWSQTVFNYKKDFHDIKNKTGNINDSLYYDKLLNRFNLNDTTLNEFEILSLLIGFTNKSEYKPYKDFETEMKILHLLSEEKYRSSLNLINTFLATNPLSLKALLAKAFVKDQWGEKDSTNFFMFKADNILKAMKYSGDGKSHNSPIFALGPHDGHDFILKFLGATIGHMGSYRDSDGNFIDTLEAKFNDGRSVNYYFIIQHALDATVNLDNKKTKKKKKNK